LFGLLVRAFFSFFFFLLVAFRIGQTTPLTIFENVGLSLDSGSC
jgi:hypothetical protein